MLGGKQTNGLFVLVFQQQEALLQTSKVELSFECCLVWLFRIASILQKQFSLKLQFLAFGFPRINYTLNFIF